MESDLVVMARVSSSGLSFLSTLSAWRATILSALKVSRFLNSFLSTLSAWRATCCFPRIRPLPFLSIHALRMESDLTSIAGLPETKSLSIHALRMESDRGKQVAKDFLAKTFLSTLSAWRATSLCVVYNVHKRGFLSTLSAWRATSTVELLFCARLSFYPRSPHGERQRVEYQCSLAYAFYPRSPHGERRHYATIRAWARRLSIHALRMESDLFAEVHPSITNTFYPRSPHGERLSTLNILICCNISFYPRSPHGERRKEWIQMLCDNFLSIHALRMESDPAWRSLSGSAPSFLSTLSAWRATVRCSHS